MGTALCNVLVSVHSRADAAPVSDPCGQCTTRSVCASSGVCAVLCVTSLRDAYRRSESILRCYVLSTGPSPVSAIGSHVDGTVITASAPNRHD